MNKNKIFVALLLCPFLGAAQSTLYQNALLHFGTGAKAARGHLLINEGKIAWMGNLAASLPEADSIVDGTGLQLYPGFIAPGTPVGLVEIESVRATDDQSETGDLNPNVRAAIAFNTDSRILPTLLANGILLAQVTPQGGLISGKSAVMRLHAWNWEDAAIQLEDGMHIRWPGQMRFNREKGKLEADPDYAVKTQKIWDVVAAGKAYQESPTSTQQAPNLKLAAFDGVFDGNKRFYVHTNSAAAMLEIARKANELGIKNLVFVGAAEAHLIAGFLHDNNIPLILDRVHSTPNRSDDMVHTPYALPKILQEAGVLFCFSNMGDMAVMGNRNLPFMAGTAVGFGLMYEAAVAGLSGNAAKILGIDAQYGTLEVGKSATLIVATGDLLDARTHQIQTLWLDGRPIVQDNWQEHLYHKYLEKYGLEK
jgi:imidazolonepropionase-like amidohydrolase